MERLIGFLMEMNLCVCREVMKVCGQVENSQGISIPLHFSSSIFLRWVSISSTELAHVMVHSFMFQLD